MRTRASGGHIEQPDPAALAFRAWVAGLVEQYDSLSRSPLDRAHRQRAKELRRLLSTLDGAHARSSKDCLRRLIAAGLVRYAGITDRLTPDALPADVMFDLAGVALWPIVIAPSLPADWMGALQGISSPELARTVAHARNFHEAGAAGDELTHFLRSLADASLGAGLYHLFDDMSDPGRGGSALAAVAIASGGKPPKLTGARGVLVWVLGAAAAGIVGNRADDLIGNLWDSMSASHHAAGSHGDPLDHQGGGHHGHHGNSHDHHGHGGSHANHGEGLAELIEGLFR